MPVVCIEGSCKLQKKKTIIIMYFVHFSLRNSHNQFVRLRFSHDLYVINNGDNIHSDLVRDRTRLGAIESQDKIQNKNSIFLFTIVKWQRTSRVFLSGPGYWVTVTMVKLSARLFVLVLNTCFCYTNAFPYQIYNPFHRGIPLPRIVPIKPMNYSTIRRSTHKLPPINPLAEQVFIPKSLQQRYRPEQIMERLTSSASNAHTRKHKNNKFNLLNFDAYTLKPMNLNYNTVLATLTPETERIFKILNRTDVKNDPKVSSSSHRPHHKCKFPVWFGEFNVLSDGFD